MREIRYREALREAMLEEMERDERVFLMGEEVGHYQGAYKVSEGLLSRFGEKRVIGHTDYEGLRRTITAQVCEVSKPLLSVRKLVESSHSVIFDRQGGRITNDTTGEQIWLHEVDGMYRLRMWVPTNATSGAGF